MEADAPTLETNEDAPELVREERAPEALETEAREAAETSAEVVLQDAPDARPQYEEQDAEVAARTSEATAAFETDAARDVAESAAEFTPFERTWSALTAWKSMTPISARPWRTCRL